MISSPFVSILIPSYNNGRYIRAAIISCLEQTYPHIEVIVIDDGSEDNTQSVVKDIEDDRVFYIKHEQNLGVSAAFNTGVQKSTGEYVAFLGADDLYEKDKVAEQLKLFTDGVGLVYCGIKKVDENLQMFNECRAHGLPWDHVTNGETIGGTAMVKRECFNDAGLFDTELNYYEDMDLYYRIHQKGYGFAHVEKALYVYRYHQTNNGKNRDLLLENIDRYYGKHLGTADRKTGLRILAQKYSQKVLIHSGSDPLLAICYASLSVILYPGYTCRFFSKRLSDRLS